MMSSSSVHALRLSGNSVFRSLVLSSAWLLFSVANPVAAQTDSLRSEIHQRLVEGHIAIPYGQTDEAMSFIHVDSANVENIVLFYTGRSQDVDLWVSQDSQNGWNREHLWPQSHGAHRLPAQSDLFHVMPADASVNGRRGSLAFDEGGRPEGEAPDTFLDEDSFEPRDEIKGDIARALFYMDVRYEGFNNEPDLILVDRTENLGEHEHGDMCSLLNWHNADPVSDEERHRNDMTQGSQGNRNVFIDEPALVNALFADACAPAASITSANNSSNDQSALTVNGEAEAVSVIAGTVEPAPTNQLTDSLTNQLRIATWNIANLHHQSGEYLRPGSAVRDDEDYQRLANLAQSLELDIVALQEVGSPAAIRRVFPVEHFHAVISNRYVTGAEKKPATERDIYTALVFSKQRFPELPPTHTLDALSIAHIGFDRDDKPSSRPTRAGMVAELMIAGERVNLLGIHLKSFCHRWSMYPVQDENPEKAYPFSSRFSCRTLRAQLSILENWVEQQSAQGIIPIVLGDFNRRLNAKQDNGEADQFWLGLNDGTPNQLQLAKGPDGLDTVCWPKHTGRFDEHIDLVVYDAKLVEAANVTSIEKYSMGFESDPKYAERESQRLSDHCPVVMSLEW